MCETKTGELRPEDVLEIAKRAVRGIRRRGLPAWANADDLISEGYMAVLESGATEEGLAMTIARNAMLNALRGERLRQRGRVEMPESTPIRVIAFDLYGLSDKAPRLDAIDPDRGAKLYDAMAALPPREHQVLTMFFFQGLSQTEIAKQIGISQPAVCKILTRAEKKLRAEVIKRNSQVLTTIEGKNELVWGIWQRRQKRDSTHQNRP